jgi:hypothetical protein
MRMLGTCSRAVTRKPTCAASSWPRWKPHTASMHVAAMMMLPMASSHVEMNSLADQYAIQARAHARLRRTCRRTNAVAAAGPNARRVPTPRTASA